MLTKFINMFRPLCFTGSANLQIAFCVYRIKINVVRSQFDYNNLLNT